MIKKLTLRDFKTHKDSILELSPGINVITGDSGQGKTNILLGMNWVVDNRPLGPNCIRRGQNSGAVEMEVGEDGNHYTVTRSRGASENSYTIESNGVKQDPFTGFRNAPPTVVSDILNLSDLNVQKQRDQHFLVYTPPGQIATYIRSITRLDEIDRVTKSLSGKVRVEKGRIDSRQEDLESTNKQLAALSALNLPLLESKIKGAKVHIVEVNRLGAKIERLNIIVNALRALEKRQIHIPDNIDQIFDKVEQSSEGIIEVSNEISKLKSLIDKIRNIEVNEIILPDNVDQMFDSAEQSSKAIVEVSDCIGKLKPLMNKIRNIEVNGVVLPENLEVIFTVGDTLEQYNYIDKKLETLVNLLEDIQKVEVKIGTGATQLKQLELEEVKLKEKLEDCPHCGLALTEESKLILLGK